MGSGPEDNYSPINRALLSARLRASRLSGDNPEVNLPALLPRLSGPNSQLLYGRQGSGKSHLLLTLRREAAGDQLPIYIDLKNVGATSDLFEEQPQTSLAARATRLAVDVLAAVHSATHRHALASDTLDEELASALDSLADAISQIRVSGPEERSELVESTRSETGSGNAEINIGPTGVGARIGFDESTKADERASTAITQRGHADVWLHLASVRQALEDLARSCGPVLVLIDDWSSLPLELQPWLADLTRRIFWDTAGYVVKIAAIPSESRFLINTEAGTVGLNPHDANALSLDGPTEDEPFRSPSFVGALLHEHALYATLSSARRDELPGTAEEFAQAAFEANGLEILAAAAEGNPRDALVLAGQAATMAGNDRIAEEHILRASLVLLTEHKDLSIATDALVRWLARDVYRPNSRSFYVERSVLKVPAVLEPMYAARLIHPGAESLSDIPEHGFTTIYEEWHVDYSLAVHLASMKGVSISSPPPPAPYRDIADAPVLRTEDFQHTAVWVIDSGGPLGGANGVEQAWAAGPPVWVRTVAKGLPPNGDYLIIDAGSAVEAVPLERSPIGIGRASSDIRIVDYTVSRNHANLYKTGDTWRIVDSESRNGVMVDGVKKPWHELASGDIVLLGGVVLFFLRTNP